MTEYYLYKVINRRGGVESYTFREHDSKNGQGVKGFKNLGEMVKAFPRLCDRDMVYTIPGPRAEVTPIGFTMEVPLTQRELRRFLQKEDERI